MVVVTTPAGSSGAAAIGVVAAERSRVPRPQGRRRICVDTTIASKR
jgi:hypothetical protein